MVHGVIAIAMAASGYLNELLEHIRLPNDRSPRQPMESEFVANDSERIHPSRRHFMRNAGALALAALPHD
jgi:hypothetical protein